MACFNQVVNGVIQIRPRCSTESFTGSKHTTLASAKMADFWRWAYSNIIGNTDRGTVAEFIVSRALGTDAPVRNDWAAYDLKTTTGIRIEVKSSAYLQSWNQRQKFSKPIFNIRKVKEWNPETNEYVGESCRHSDVYVFCLLSFRGEKRCLNPLDLAQWEFYVVATSLLDKDFRDRKSISLHQVKKLSRAYAVDDLVQAVEKANEAGKNIV